MVVDSRAAEAAPAVPVDAATANDLERRQLEFDILFDALPGVPLRDQRDALERPIVSLSKNIRYNDKKYEYGELYIQIRPHQDFGQPTIWDYDIVMFLLGQMNLRFARDRDHGPAPSPVIEKQIRDGRAVYVQRPGWKWNAPAITVDPAALLRGIGRGTGGKDYKALREAIGRLQSCQIETNIWHGKMLKRFKRFTLISGFEEDDPGEASSAGMRFTLPAWMIDSLVTRKGIFLIDKRYFDLAGGYQRFLYRVARKIAGRQRDWRPISMKTLYDRSGSPMEYKDFAKTIRRTIAGCKEAPIPEYDFRITIGAEGQEIIAMQVSRHDAGE